MTLDVDFTELNLTTDKNLIFPHGTVCELLIPDKQIPVCFSDVGVKDICHFMVETISRVLKRCRWTSGGGTLEVGFTHSCLTAPRRTKNDQRNCLGGEGRAECVAMVTESSLSGQNSLKIDQSFPADQLLDPSHFPHPSVAASCCQRGNYLMNGLFQDSQCQFQDILE